MVIYRFPQESGGGNGTSDKRSNQQSDAKSPDFIYIDEERKTADGGFSSQGIFNSSKNEKKNYPPIMRIGTLVIGIALTIWTLLLCVVFVLLGCFAAILLFQPSPAMRMFKRLWSPICCMSAYALAFYVATVSPVFGFGILGLYTMQNGKNIESSFFARFFKK